MRVEVLLLAVVVGAFTWAFRYLPLRLPLGDIAPNSRLGRFLAATSPAAISALFVAEVLPLIRAADPQIVATSVGVAAVIGVFWWKRSVVLSTLAGAVAFGLASWALTG